jgi:hypothetical protein
MNKPQRELRSSQVPARARDHDSPQRQRADFSPALAKAYSLKLRYAFFGAIASFAALATRNFTTVFALI